MATYNFVIDSSFRPYSFEERVKPYLLYKDAYDKAEAVYDELSDKADTFSYLADKLGDDPNNKAAQIYKGYADELQRQADDFARNGLTMANRRALGNLKRRYQGEIGQLVRADERMKEVQKKRDALQAAGKQMFYGVENLDINDFLGDGSQFNGYAIDAEDLRREAADYAKNVSSSLYDSDLVESTNKHFLKEVEKYGRDPEILAAWRSDLESIPEFQNAVNDIVRARGIDTNLKGADYDSAVQTIINGVMEGAVSKTTHKYVSNPDVLTAAQQNAAAKAERAQILSENRAGLKWNPTTQSYDRNDPNEWMYTHEDENNPNTSARTGLSKEGEKYLRTKGRGGSANSGMTKDLRTIVENNGNTSNGTVITRDADGNISTVKVDLSSSQTYAPFYGDAWLNKADKGFDIENYDSSAFSESDAENFLFNDLASDKAKEQMRNYVRELIPSVVDDLEDSQIDTIISFMDLQRDYDVFSDNHFRLKIPGTDAEGKVKDKTKFNNFLSKINQLKMGIVSANDTSTNSTENTESTPSMYTPTESLYSPGVDAEVLDSLQNFGIPAGY